MTDEQAGPGSAKIRKGGSYRRARIFAWIMLGSLVAMALIPLLVLPLELGGAPPPSHGAPSAEAPATTFQTVALLISGATFLISGIGTASSVILGWRNERRQSAEFRLRIEQLERQVAEARQQADANSKG